MALAVLDRLKGLPKRRASNHRLLLALNFHSIGISGQGASSSAFSEALPLTEADDWASRLQPFATWLDQAKLGKLSATLQVSNRHARFALMPWSDDVAGIEEEQALAQACLETQYGDVSDWTFRLDAGRYGEARLVCAVETSLLEALRQILEPRDIRCSLIQPYFATCWNRWQREITKDISDFCFAVAEGDVVVLATCKEGRWHSVRTVGYLDIDLVPTLAEREALLQGFTQPLPVYLHSPGLDANRCKQWRERCHLLDLPANVSNPVLAMASLGAVQ